MPIGLLVETSRATRRVVLEGVTLTIVKTRAIELATRTSRAAVVIMTIAATLAGCTSHKPSAAQQLFNRAVVPEDQIRLDDAVVAFFVGPQNDEMNTPVGEVTKPGYLVLANAQGKIRAVKTKRMDMMMPAWSDHGLHFADEDHDYRLTASGLAKFRSSKAAAQNLMFGLSGDMSVGVFNGGNTANGGYDNQITVTADGVTRLYHVQGNYFTGALCDGQVFGITIRPGTHSRELGGSSGGTGSLSSTNEPQVLVRIYPVTADGGEEVIGWRPYGESSTPAWRVPCHEGVIHYLSWEIDAEGGGLPKVISWRTATGKYQANPLVFDNAGPVGRDDLSLVVQDWHDGQLHWVTAGGQVFSTDPATGKTTSLFSARFDVSSNHGRDTRFAFSATRLHALSTVRNDGGDVVYATFDRITGELLSSVSLPIPNSKINISHLNLTHMAVDPKI